MTHAHYLKKKNANAYNFFIETRSKLEGVLNSASLNHARMLVVYLLDNPLSEQRASKDFKNRFSHLLEDISSCNGNTLSFQDASGIAPEQNTCRNIEVDFNI